VKVQRKADGAIYARSQTSPLLSRFKEDFRSSKAHKPGESSLFSTLGLQVSGRVRNKHALPQSKTVHLSQFVLSSDETCSNASSGGKFSSSCSKVPIHQSMVDGNECRSQDASAIESQHEPRGISSTSEGSVQGHINISSLKHQEISPIMTTAIVHTRSRPPLHKTYTHDAQRFPLVPQRLALPPESWAKYPSFDREKRNREAQSKDQVKARDFARRLLTQPGRSALTTDNVYTEKRDDGVVTSPSMRHKFGKYLMRKMDQLLFLQNSAMEIGRSSQGERNQGFPFDTEVMSDSVADPTFILNRAQSINYHNSPISARSTSDFLPQAMRQTGLDDAGSRGDKEVAEGCRELSTSTLPTSNLHEGRKKQSDHRLELDTKLSNTDSITGNLANSYNGRLPSTASNKTVVFRKFGVANSKNIYTRSFTWSGPLSMHFAS
jgi:hypothetical protein